MRDSRRARIVLALLLLVSLTFVVVDLRGGGGGARGFGGAVFGPVERGVATVVRPVGSFFGSLGRIRGNQKRIDELEASNSQLQEQLRSVTSQQAKVAQLQSLLRLAGTGGYRIVPAQVVSVGATQGFAWTIALDAGARDGVRVDQTVLNGDGLVGRVVSTSRWTSTVLLIIDPTSSLGARIATTREIGIASGRALEPMQLQLLDPQAPLKAGEQLVSFGSRGGRPFVAGVPVGRVTSVRGTPGSLTRVATVTPFVNFSALDIVGVVVQAPRVDPRDSVLPPKPQPATTPTPTTPAATSGSTPVPTPTSSGG